MDISSLERAEFAGIRVHWGDTASHAHVCTRRHTQAHTHTGSDIGRTGLGFGGKSIPPFNFTGNRARGLNDRYPGGEGNGS